MPRILEHTETRRFDERAEILLEPGQTVDLLQHWQAVPITKRTKEPRWEYTADGSLLISNITTTHPDVFITFMCDADYQPRIIGGPLVVQNERTDWTVPVRRMFSLSATNRSRDTLRERVYMRVITAARRGW